MRVRCRPSWDPNVSTLLAGSGPELDYQVSGYPAAVFYLDALRLGPLADLDGVQITCRPASAPAGAAGDSASSIHVPGQCIPQFLGVPGVQVDLILGAVRLLGAVRPEADGTLGGAAVEVFDEQGLYLLSHSPPGSSHWSLAH